MPFAARARKFNETAEMLRSCFAKIDVGRILGIGGFMPAPMVMPDRTLSHIRDESCDHEGEHEPDLGHTHCPSVGPVARVFDAPFDRARLLHWLARLAEKRGEQLFRARKASSRSQATSGAMSCRACIG